MISARRLFAAHATPGGAVVALQGLSLDVRAGELLAVLGPSGAGKSTLMACLAGTKRPLAGELHAFGARLHDAPDRAVAAWRAANVAVVGQRYARMLSSDLPALALVEQPAALRGASRRERRARALSLLERAGLRGRETARRPELSGGEQQRLALCAALCASPRLLLADEVTGELDAATGRSILALLRSLTDDEGVTVVLATHDGRAAEIADRTVTVRDGRVTTEADVATGRAFVLVDESGVLRLDPDDVAAAGIAGRARLERRDGAIVLHGEAAPTVAEAPPAATSERAARRTGGPPFVVLDEAGRSYAGQVALEPVSLVVDEPGLHALVGPSGSGKTTLLHLVAGLERPDTGTVHVCGEALAGRSREALAALRRELLTFAPQASALAGHLTVREHVALALELRGRRDDAEVDAAIAAVGLADLADRRADHLSGGERQRAALARALAPRPAVVLADEPTANLDQQNAIRVAELLHAAAHERGCAVLCATHDPSVVARADRVLSMG